MANTGSPSTTANTSRFTAVRALATVDRASPAATKIRYCSAAPSGPPPGAMFDSALDASCAEITGRQWTPPSATRCRSHMQAQTPTCRRNITSIHAGEKRVICRQEEKVSTSAGNTR